MIKTDSAQLMSKLTKNAILATEPLVKQSIKMSFYIRWCCNLLTCCSRVISVLQSLTSNDFLLPCILLIFSSVPPLWTLLEAMFHFHTLVSTCYICVCWFRSFFDSKCISYNCYEYFPSLQIKIWQRISKIIVEKKDHSK